MNFSELFKLQKNLDRRIIDEHNLKETSIYNKKLLALEVEMGELANEVRCFKFWSNKKASKKEVILEEYVDCLHFILSIGLESNFQCDEIKISNDNIDEQDITKQFLNLYIDITDFIICPTKDHYITLFEDFLKLGISLEFDEDDIKKAYYKKNNVNHKRQTSGY